MSNVLNRSLVAVTALLMVLAGMRIPSGLSPQVWGCAPAPHPGEQVRIESEQAVIVWDEKAGVEHFIRQARFDTTAKDFGFLVPTPTEPELGEVSEAIFSKFSELTAPKIEYVTQRVRLEQMPRAASAAPNAMPVQVLQQKEVAGLDAVVLKAEDPTSLGTWLSDHGYAFRPELHAWLKAYIDRQWIITAFKVGKKEPSETQVASQAIRMSFHCQRPFYPYREPEDLRDPAKTHGQSRLLRVFVVAPDRQSATLGETGTPWQATTVWAKPVESLPAILKGFEIPAFTPKSALWLTEFEDRSAPRPGTDELYFSACSDQNLVERPPVIHTIIQYAGEAATPNPWEVIQIYAWPIGIVVATVLFWGWRKFVRAVERRDNSGATPP